MRDTTKQKIRRTIAGTLAAVMAISGTFAWRNLSGEGVNEFFGGSLLDVKLVEDFEEPEDWKPGQEANKDISVKNTGDEALYVRVKLSEYMETNVYQYEGFSNGEATRFALNTKGEFIRMEEDKDYKGDTFKPVNGDYPGKTYTRDQVVYIANPAKGEAGWFLKAAGADFDGKDSGANADNTNANGQVGAWMPVKGDTMAKYPTGASKDKTETYDVFEYSLVDSGTSTNPTTNEVYDVNVAKSWDDDSSDPAYTANAATGKHNMKMHEYVQWNMGENVITMAQWIANKQMPGNFWVLDTDGWAYWANPLAPNTSTGKLLDSVTLVTAPGHNEDAGEAGGSFFYTIHAQLDAATKEQVSKWWTNGKNPTAQPDQKAEKNSTVTDAGQDLVEIVTGVPVEEEPDPSENATYVLTNDGVKTLGDTNADNKLEPGVSSVNGLFQVKPTGSTSTPFPGTLSLSNNHPEIGDVKVLQEGIGKQAANDDSLTELEPGVKYEVTFKKYGMLKVTATPSKVEGVTVDTANGTQQTIFFALSQDGKTSWVPINGTNFIWGKVNEKGLTGEFVDAGKDNIPGNGDDVKVENKYYDFNTETIKPGTKYEAFDGTSSSTPHNTQKDGFLTEDEAARADGGEEPLPEGVVEGGDGKYYKPYDNAHVR